MRSTVLEILCGLLLVSSAIGASAVDRPPITLQDPTFHLRYDSRVVKFEPIDISVLQRCGQISYLPHVTPVWFIFGRTVDAQGRVFYATGGWSIRTNPNPPLTRKYETEGLGLIFFMEGDRCQEIGSIMDTFTAGSYEETTQEVLSTLAADMATRYAKAFNGSKALKHAFQKQRVKRNKYATELNKAFDPYYAK